VFEPLAQGRVGQAELAGDHAPGEAEGFPCFPQGFASGFSSSLTSGFSTGFTPGFTAGFTPGLSLGEGFGNLGFQQFLHLPGIGAFAGRDFLQKCVQHGILQQGPDLIRIYHMGGQVQHGRQGFGEIGAVVELLEQAADVVRLQAPPGKQGKRPPGSIEPGGEEFTGLELGQDDLVEIDLEREAQEVLVEGRGAPTPSRVQIDHHGHDGQAVLQAQMPRQGGEAFG